jgi:hypothetical protein
MFYCPFPIGEKDQKPFDKKNSRRLLRRLRSNSFLSYLEFIISLRPSIKLPFVTFKNRDSVKNKTLSNENELKSYLQTR